MGHERQVKLFRNGRNRAVRIPKEFDFFGKDVVMKREGERLILERKPKPSLIELLDSLEPIDEEWPEIDDPPPEPVDF